MLPDERPLALVERAGLVEDLVGHGELAEVVELRGALQLLELVAPEPEHLPDLDRECADAGDLRLDVGLSDGQRLEQRRDRAAALAAPRVLLRVQALVGDLERAARVLRLVREHHRTERAADLEPFAALAERLAGAVDERFGIAVAHGRDQAELVAAEAVHGAGVSRDLRELAPRRARSASPAGCPKESL